MCTLRICADVDGAKPEPFEYEMCSGFLDKQIDALSPGLIVTLGRAATERVVGNPIKITAIRGEVIRSDKYNADIFPMYHPSFVGPYSLRSRRVEFATDIRELKTVAAKHIDR